MEPKKSETVIEKSRLHNQYRLIWGLLVFVVITINVPMFMELIYRRKPSDAILNNQNQSALLITGALCNAIGMLFGYSQGMSDAKTQEKGERQLNDPGPESDNTDTTITGPPDL